ncbi:MAG: hypothetical protein IK099_08755 [Clostridia bacterium]|nr:hypothetical protein [Clostridia bacterium]
MKKLLALLLALFLACGFCFAQAEAADVMLGSWTCEYMGIPLYCLLYEDNTFEAVIGMDLPIEKKTLSGTWEFDGEAVILHCGEKDLPFTWDGNTLTGELFGVPVALESVWKNHDPLADIREAERERLILSEDGMPETNE